jgi:hypothetical protein
MEVEDRWRPRINAVLGCSICKEGPGECINVLAPAQVFNLNQTQNHRHGWVQQRMEHGHCE